MASMPPKEIYLRLPQRLTVAWILVPCLASLRTEFDQLAPDRDRRSDGTIGDQAHAGSVSDHNPDETGSTAYEDFDDVNEVHALDVDADLDRDRPELMERCVQTIVARHLAGDDDRLQNVIYRRRIWSASWAWAEKPYTGSSPHNEHAHFSARYTTEQESDTRPWGLITGDDMDRKEFLGHLRAALADPDIRWKIASAVATTDNVVAGQPDEAAEWGLQSLIRWPGGHAEAARDNALAAFERANEAVAIAERIEAKLAELTPAATVKPGVTPKPSAPK